MGIPEELKQVAIDRRSMEQEVWTKQHKYDYERKYGRKRHNHSVEAFNRAYGDMAKIHNRIQELKQNIEDNKVREQGLIEQWNAEKMQLADQKLRKELAIEQGKLKTAERKAQARGGHPEHGLSATYRPPPRRAKSGVRSRYQAPKRRSTPRPRPRPRPQGRR